MLKIENVDIFGWEAAIRGMRNPMNSWDKSDSYETRVENPVTAETGHHQFVVGDAFHLLNDHQRAGDLVYSLVFFNHSSSPPCAHSAICCFISSQISL